jgi:DNA-binding transcriptional LysR family regulator
MPAFLERYPDVEIELAMSDAFVDLVEAGLDLAIRVGDLVDPSLIARRIGTTRRVDSGLLGLSGAARGADGSH